MSDHEPKTRSTSGCWRDPCFHAKAEVIGDAPERTRQMGLNARGLRLRRRQIRVCGRRATIGALPCFDPTLRAKGEGMKRAGAGLMVAVVAGLCLIGAGPAWAVSLGQNGRIVYLDSDFSIHTILPSGHGDSVVGPQTSELASSPNGRRIAFVGAGGDIYTVRADGSDVRRLTSDGGNSGPSYSPHGGRIVFTHNGTIMVMRSHGSKRRAIGRGRAVTWSPNGEIIYFQAGDPRPSLRTMRPDGADKHQLVMLGGNGGTLNSYSPDGSEFVFTRFRNDESARTFLADANGGSIRRPPCERAISAQQVGHYGFSRWPVTYSPDGRWFLAWNGEASQALGSLTRISLSSCAGKRVVGRGARPDADWQALPAP